MTLIILFLPLCLVPVFGVNISDVSGTVGMATTLRCTLFGSSVTMAMYHFFKGGVSVGTSSTYMYTIPMALLSDAGNDYTCEVVISLEYLDLSSPLTLSSNQQATLSLTSEFIMPRCICTSEVYGSVSVCVDCYSCSQGSMKCK